MRGAGFRAGSPLRGDELNQAPRDGRPKVAAELVEALVLRKAKHGITLQWSGVACPARVRRPYRHRLDGNEQEMGGGLHGRSMHGPACDTVGMDIRATYHRLIETIEDAGTLAFAYFNANESANELKDDGSVVTKVDQEIETRLLAFINQQFPDDAIVGEEHGSKDGTSGFVWHVDPIDGTDNFIRKIPFCAVSVARLGDTAEDSFGIVHNPFTRQTFSSLMDEGVYENEHVHNLTADPLGGRYVISIGRGKTEEWMRPAGFALQKELAVAFGKCHAYGSSALELAYVAANRIDAYLTFGLKSYDYAAGLFLVASAGGAISVFEEGAWRRWTGSLKELCSTHERIIFASHPDIHAKMLDFIGDPHAWADR